MRLTALDIAVGLVLCATAFWFGRSPDTSRQTASFQEQHSLAHLESLPVAQIEDLTLVFAATAGVQPQEFPLPRAPGSADR